MKLLKMRAGRERVEDKRRNLESESGMSREDAGGGQLELNKAFVE